MGSSKPVSGKNVLQDEMILDWCAKVVASAHQQQNQKEPSGSNKNGGKARNQR